jgi:DNA-binding NarL/FixJ family response regulator
MNILLADDHLMTLEGYISILNNPEYQYSKLLTCEQIYHWIMQGNIPDVAVLDHDMPSYKELELNSGADCALLIRQYAPDCKIILITAHEEAVILYNMYKKTHPDALIVKSDFTGEIFRVLVGKDISESSYLSPKAKAAVKSIMNRLTLLDPTNREILMYLSHGFKIFQIQDFISLSTSGIQKRISKMLQEFDVSDYQELIVLVKKEGLL